MLSFVDSSTAWDTLVSPDLPVQLASTFFGSAARLRRLFFATSAVISGCALDCEPHEALCATGTGHEHHCELGFFRYGATDRHFVLAQNRRCKLYAGFGRRSE